MEKESRVRFTFASRHIFLILITMLAFALVACERPLNEEVPTPTLVPPVEGAPATAPDGSTPILVPTLEVVPPTTDTTAPDGGQPEGDGEPDPAVPPEGGEVTEPADQTQAPPPTDASEPVTLPSGEQVHTVAAGENLYRIGLRYGCTVPELAAYNGIANPNYINVGQQIRIPTTCGG